MYTYQRLIDDIVYLGYNGADTGSIGKTVLGNEIPYIHLGNYHDKQIIIMAGIHARENIASLLAVRQAYNLMFSLTDFEGGIYFIPMLNVDGALLIEKGADIDKNRKQQLIQFNDGSDDFSLWKANINGVDLNNNFDALFYDGIAQGESPKSHGYRGRYPFSEPESEALRQFTYKVNPRATLSYHALGREVYYNFHQNKEDLERDRLIAEKISKHLNYRLIDTTLGSSGGYKDWCIDKLKIPSFTIEIIDSSHTHPLDICLLEEDYEQNRDIPALLSRLV